MDETIDTGTSKKSTSRKKRRSKMSTKKSVVEIESSPRFLPDDDPDFFPDPNLRLALQSLRVIKTLTNNYKSRRISTTQGLFTPLDLSLLTRQNSMFFEFFFIKVIILVSFFTKCFCPPCETFTLKKGCGRP